MQFSLLPSFVFSDQLGYASLKNACYVGTLDQPVAEEGPIYFIK